LQKRKFEFESFMPVLVPAGQDQAGYLLCNI